MWTKQSKAYLLSLNAVRCLLQGFNLKQAKTSMFEWFWSSNLVLSAVRAPDVNCTNLEIGPELVKTKMRI